MKRLSLCAAVGVLALVGCQTVPYQPYARAVKMKPDQGGVIALHSEYRDEDKAKALDMMRTACGANPYKITEEGEVVVGQTTNTNTNENTDYGNKHQVGTFLGLPVTTGSDRQNNVNSNATTTQLKEWQMTYECQVAQNDSTGLQTATATKKKKVTNP